MTKYLLTVALLIGANTNSVHAKAFRGVAPAAQQAHRELQTISANSDEYDMTENTDLDASGSDSLLNNDSVSFGGLEVTGFSESGDIHGSLSVFTNGDFEYTPDEDYTGSVAFTYDVCSTENTAVCTNNVNVRINVNVDPNRPDKDPVGNADEYFVREGDTLEENPNGILGNDDEGNPFNPLFVCETNEDTTNELDTDRDGSFTYEARKCWTGTERFTYRACYEDFPNMRSDETTVTITVQEDPNRPDGPPQPEDDYYTVEEAEELSKGESDGVLWNDIGGPDLYVKRADRIGDFRGDLKVGDKGDFVYKSVSGEKGIMTFEYEVCYDGWEDCFDCRTGTARIEVITNPRKPTSDPTPKTGVTIEVEAGVRHRDNVFDYVDYVDTYTLEVTLWNDAGLDGTLLGEDDGDFSYGQAPVGTVETFSYTVCYVEWPDLCSTGQITMETVAGTPTADSIPRQGVATLYQIHWDGQFQGGCDPIQPSLTVYCDAGGELALSNTGPSDNSLCTINTVGHLNCQAQNSGTVHIECRDTSGRNPQRRKAVASLGSAPVSCTGNLLRQTFQSLGIRAWCRNAWQDVALDYCSGDTLSDGNGGELCYADDVTATNTAKVEDIVATSTVDNVCILLQGSLIPAAEPPTLERLGNNDSPDEAFPLGQCKGDCDNDGDCAGDLVCFQRRDDEIVPGCVANPNGDDLDGVDFCIERWPSVSLTSGLVVRDGNEQTTTTELQLVVVGNSDNSHPHYPLEECEGDCDDDDHCTGDLVCYQTDDSEPVPGCTGRDSTMADLDFCIRPELEPGK